MTKRNADYVFLKHIFDSQTGNEKASFTPNELEQASKLGLIDRHVYALGGMNIDNIRMAKELGFGGVVICGDLWNRFNIHQGLDYKELIAHFEKLQSQSSQRCRITTRQSLPQSMSLVSQRQQALTRR